MTPLNPAWKSLKFTGPGPNDIELVGDIRYKSRLINLLNAPDVSGLQKSVGESELERDERRERERAATQRGVSQFDARGAE